MVKVDTTKVKVTKDLKTSHGTKKYAKAKWMDFIRFKNKMVKHNDWDIRRSWEEWMKYYRIPGNASY